MSEARDCWTTLAIAKSKESGSSVQSHIFMYLCRGRTTFLQSIKSYPLTPPVLGLERDISFYATSIIFIFRQRTLTATSGEHSHVDVNIN